jgi:tetratricopeptide (TPR) repeat protein
MFPLRHHRTTWVLYSLLMAALAVLAFGGLGNQLFDTDDFEYLGDAAAISEDLSLFFSADRQLPGRPLVDLVFLLAHTLWGADPAPYHWLLVGLHLGASLVLAWAFHCLGAGLGLSLMGGVFFLLNAAHFRAVQWISCLAYPLALGFALFAVILFARYLEGDRRSMLLWATLMQGLGVLCHASALCAALFGAHLSRQQGHQPLRAWPLLVVAFAGVLFLHLLYPHSPQSRELMDFAGFWPALADLCGYLGRLLLGAHWLVAGPLRNWEWMAGALGAVGLLSLALRRAGQASDWALWALLALLPFAGHPTHDPSRYLYLSSAGTSLVLAWLVGQLVQCLPGGRRVALAAILILLAGCSLFSLKKAEALGYYYSGRAYDTRGEGPTALALYKKALAIGPHQLPPDARLRLVAAGFRYGESGQEVLETALTQDPNASEWHLLRAASLFLKADLEQHGRADALIRAALERAPNATLLRRQGAVAFHNLGLHHLEGARPGLAIACFERALRLRPDYALTLAGLGQALATQGRHQEAIAAYREAIRLKPELAAALYELSLLLFQEGDLQGAIAALEQVVAQKPDSSPSWYLLSQFYRQAGDAGAALRAIGRALAVDSSESRYWVEYGNVGILYHAQGQTGRALAVYQQVAQALPEYPTTHFNLGLLHYQEGRFAQAEAAFRRAVQLDPSDEQARLGLERASRGLEGTPVSLWAEGAPLAAAF